MTPQAERSLNGLIAFANNRSTTLYLCYNDSKEQGRRKAPGFLDRRHIMAAKMPSFLRRIYYGT